MTFREAKLSDIPGMMEVRMSVKENVLSDPKLVPERAYVEYLTERGKGWICEADNQIVGFAIADVKDHNIWALFVKPEYERMGIGKNLHDTMLDWYFTQTSEKVWLGTAPKSRAETFYRKAGWSETGIHGKGEIKFEMTFDEWTNNDLYSSNFSDI